MCWLLNEQSGHLSFEALPNGLPNLKLLREPNHEVARVSAMWSAPLYPTEFDKPNDGRQQAHCSLHESLILSRRTSRLRIEVFTLDLGIATT